MEYFKRKDRDKKDRTLETILIDQKLKDRYQMVYLQNIKEPERSGQKKKKKPGSLTVKNAVVNRRDERKGRKGWERD